MPRNLSISVHLVSWCICLGENMGCDGICICWSPPAIRACISSRCALVDPASTILLLSALLLLSVLSVSDQLLLPPRIDCPLDIETNLSGCPEYLVVVSLPTLSQVSHLRLEHLGACIFLKAALVSPTASVRLVEIISQRTQTSLSTIPGTKSRRKLAKLSNC